MKNKHKNKKKKSFNPFLISYRIELLVLLFILLILWVLFNLIPQIFYSLFSNFFGNSVLFICVLLVSSYNIRHGIVLAVILVILYHFVNKSKSKSKNKSVEGFTWNSNSKREFLIIQNTNNPNRIFDLDMIEKNQASQEELDYFNENGMWPWSDNTKDLYIKAIKKNTYIKILPDESLLDAQKVYNETAILMLLSYQTKEGQFLINGVQVPVSNSIEELPNGFGDFAYKSGLKEDKSKDIIRCNMDNGLLERIHFTGKEGIYGLQTKIISEEDYNDLENNIPGFKFVNSPCNPCDAVTEKPGYSCPFQLEVKGESKNISDVWKNLWGLN